jgi:hypothetical protein
MNPVHPWLDADHVKRMADLLMRPPPAPDVYSRHDAGFGCNFVGFAVEELQVAEHGEGSAPVGDAPPLAATPLAVPAVSVAMPVGVVEPGAEPKLEFEPPPDGKPEEVQATAEVAPCPFEAVSEPDWKPGDVGSAFPEESKPAVVEEESGDQNLPSPSRALFVERIRRYRDWMHQRFSATGLFILDRDGMVIFDEGPNARLHFLARSLALASRRPGSVATNVHVKIGVGATFEVIPVDTPFGCLVVGAVLPDALGQEAVEVIRQALVRTVRHPEDPAVAEALNEPVLPVESPVAPDRPPE